MISTSVSRCCLSAWIADVVVTWTTWDNLLRSLVANIALNPCQVFVLLWSVVKFALALGTEKLRNNWHWLSLWDILGRQRTTHSHLLIRIVWHTHLSLYLHSILVLVLNWDLLINGINLWWLLIRIHLLFLLWVRLSHLLLINRLLVLLWRLTLLHRWHDVASWLSRLSILLLLLRQILLLAVNILLLWRWALSLVGFLCFKRLWFFFARSTAHFLFLFK